MILFSSDLTLAYATLIDYYSLRFQIEFTFRDAKQYWGREDFMTVSATGVSNAANLSLFMVTLTHILLEAVRQTDPQCSVLDLKARYRGAKYGRELLKLLPETPDEDLTARLLAQVAQLGRIHPTELQRVAA